MAKLSNCSRDCTDSRAYNIHSLAFHSLLTPSQDSELWDQVGAQTLALLHTKDMSVCMHVCVHSVPQSHPLHVKWAGKYEVFRGVPGTFVASNFGHLFPRRANAPPPPTLPARVLQVSSYHFTAQTPSSAPSVLRPSTNPTHDTQDPLHSATYPCLSFSRFQNKMAFPS